MKKLISCVKKNDGSVEWVDSESVPLQLGYADSNEVYVLDQNGNETRTKARFLQYTDKVLRDNEGQLLEGDMYKNGIILRFHNGKLDGQGEPAVETEDCHMEYWDKGMLQEVVTDYMRHSETWKDNVLVEVKIDTE